MVSMFLSSFSLSMMNHALKFELIVLLGILKRLNGLDLAKEAYKSPNKVIEWFGLFHEYLKIYDESMVDFLSASRVGHSKCDLRFIS